MTRLLFVLLAGSIAAVAQRQDRSLLDRIQETRRVLREFNNDLPNFTCEQRMPSYVYPLRPE